MPFVEKQHDICDCGAACLATIARFYHKKVTITTCRELTKTDSNGTSFWNI